MSIDRRLVAVAGVGLLLAIVFWFVLLAPKKTELAELDQQASALSASLDEANARIAAGELARSRFSTDYSQLVTLGKAVPDGDEQASLLVQLNQLGQRNDTRFTSIAISESGAPAPATVGGEADGELEPSVSDLSAKEADASAETSSSEAADPAPATEPGVAALPLGAIVGEAELATIPYQLKFEGNFFKFADFIGSIDHLVNFGPSGELNVDGRLMTINGFALTPGGSDSVGSMDPGQLSGTFQVTTFVTPATEGRTAGATPIGPAPDDTVPVADTGGAP